MYINLFREELIYQSEYLLFIFVYIEDTEDVIIIKQNMEIQNKPDALNAIPFDINNRNSEYDQNTYS